MIGRLKGTLLEKNAPWILLDVQGVGYELQVPMSTLFNLPEINGSCTLLTHLVVREDAHLLVRAVAARQQRVAHEGPAADLPLQAGEAEPPPPPPKPTTPPPTPRARRSTESVPCAGSSPPSPGRRGSPGPTSRPSRACSGAPRNRARRSPDGTRSARSGVRVAALRLGPLHMLDDPIRCHIA